MTMDSITNEVLQCNCQKELNRIAYSELSSEKLDYYIENKTDNFEKNKLMLSELTWSMFESASSFA